MLVKKWPAWKTENQKKQVAKYQHEAQVLKLR
jgi:hypothetical protein